MTPNEIVTELYKLPLADWQKIKETIDNGRSNSDARSQMTEDEFAMHLLTRGVISRIPSGETEKEFDDYELIDVEGEPLSEMIIRERR